MKISITEFIALGQLVKAGQVGNIPEGLRRKRKKYDSAYLDYSKSMTGQMKENPAAAGLKRSIGTGALGAVLGALATRMLTNDPNRVLAGGAAGAAVGAIPGYMSGKREAESDYSRLLYLRRLGILRPGQLEILMRYPELTALAKTKVKEDLQE